MWCTKYGWWNTTHTTSAHVSKDRTLTSEKKRADLSSDGESRNKSDPSPSNSNVNPTVGFRPTNNFMAYNLSNLSQR